MSLVSELRERLRCLLRRRREEAEMEEELRFHLEMEIGKYLRAGLSEKEARRAARLRMGGPEAIKEAVRDARGVRPLDDLWSDLRYALRGLRQAPAFALTAIVLLALGIGVNAALFSAAKTLLLDELQVENPDGLVRLRWAGENQMTRNSSDYGHSGETAEGKRVRATFSFPLFEALRDRTRSLEGLAAAAPAFLNVVGGGSAEMIQGLVVSGEYFEVLGVEAQLGRVLGPADDRADAPPVAVLSHDFWQRRFAGEPEAVGKEIVVNRLAMTIVGVLPPSYEGIQGPYREDVGEVHLPLSLAPQLMRGGEERRAGTWWWLQMIGRLAPGASAGQVQGELAGTFRATAESGMREHLASLSAEERARPQNQDRAAVPDLLVDSAARGIYDPFPEAKQQVLILGVVVLLVLLVVCTNVANLVLSRSTARRRELALRRAIGASRWRVIQQLLTEGLLLALVGGGLGVLVAFGVGKWLLAERAGELDLRVLGFIALLSLGTGLAFSLVPALRASGARAAEALQSSQRVVRSGTLLTRALLVVQMAVSVVLLVGAGLLLGTLSRLRNVDVGFSTDNVLVFRLAPGAAGYEPERLATVYDHIAESIAEIPEVRSVSFSDVAFLSGSEWSTSVFLPGDNDEDDGRQALANAVSPSFFPTLEIPLVAGRLFDDRDSAESPAVAILTRAAALEYFGRPNPLGERFGNDLDEASEVEVVGVVADVRYSDLRAAPPPILYRPHTQIPRASNRVYEVKTAVDPYRALPAVRDAVARVDPELPLMTISTQAELVEERFARERQLATAYSLFGALALLLAAVGLFGVASYGVTQRTNEIGVRMALGARGRDCMGMVLRESLALVAVGLGLGLAGAVAAGRLIEALLFDLAPTDATTLLVAALVLSVATAVAAWLPARRAARVDPMVALRVE